MDDLHSDVFMFSCKGPGWMIVNKVPMVELVLPWHAVVDLLEPSSSLDVTESLLLNLYASPCRGAYSAWVLPDTQITDHARTSDMCLAQRACSSCC